MGTLGYWYTLKNARPTLVVQQGIASLFTTIEASILQTVLGQGIFSQFLKTQANTQHTLFTPAGISTEDGTFLW